MKVRTAALGMVLAAAVSLTGTAIGQAQAGESETPDAPVVRLDMVTSSSQLATCFPRAAAEVTVALTTDTIGKDTFYINASGLKPNTDFTVFIIEKAAAPFGAVEYIGDITTDQYGRTANTFRLIVEEAFAFNNETAVRKELNSVGFWFADPADDDSCLGTGSPVTQFDGDASAGVQMMNSGTDVLP